MAPTSFKQGQIYHVASSLDTKPVGAEIWPDRPAVIISNDVLNETSQVVSIVYLTRSSRKRVSPTHVPVMSDGKPAIAMCEQIQTVDKSRLRDCLGQVTPEEMGNLSLAISAALDLTNLKGTTGWLQKWARYLEKYVTPEDAVTANDDSAKDEVIARLKAERDNYKALCENQGKTLESIRLMVI